MSVRNQNRLRPNRVRNQRRNQSRLTLWLNKSRLKIEVSRISRKSEKFYWQRPGKTPHQDQIGNPILKNSVRASIGNPGKKVIKLGSIQRDKIEFSSIYRSWIKRWHCLCWKNLTSSRWLCTLSQTTFSCTPSYVTKISVTWRTPTLKIQSLSFSWKKLSSQCWFTWGTTGLNSWISLKRMMTTSSLSFILRVSSLTRIRSCKSWTLIRRYSSTGCTRMPATCLKWRKRICYSW